MKRINQKKGKSQRQQGERRLITVDGRNTRQVDHVPPIKLSYERQTIKGFTTLDGQYMTLGLVPPAILRKVCDTYTVSRIRVVLSCLVSPTITSNYSKGTTWAIAYDATGATFTPLFDDVMRYNDSIVWRATEADNQIEITIDKPWQSMPGYSGATVSVPPFYRTPAESTYNTGQLLIAPNELYSSTTGVQIQATIFYDLECHNPRLED